MAVELLGSGGGHLSLGQQLRRHYEIYFRHADQPRPHDPSLGARSGVYVAPLAKVPCRNVRNLDRAGTEGWRKPITASFSRHSRDATYSYVQSSASFCPRYVQALRGCR